MLQPQLFSNDLQCCLNVALLLLNFATFMQRMIFCYGRLIDSRTLQQRRISAVQLSVNLCNAAGALCRSYRHSPMHVWILQGKFYNVIMD